MTDANKSKFTFIVSKSASKKEIKHAVEKLFGVNVMTVATSMIKGKTRKFGPRRMEQVLTATKKAMVQLKDGQKINAFEIGA
jgi:large subunit ribosomal protein L23